MAPKVIAAIIIIFSWGVLYYGSWVACHLKVLPATPIWIAEAIIVIVVLSGLYSHKDII